MFCHAKTIEGYPQSLGSNHRIEFANVNFLHYKESPHLCGFHYHGSHYHDFCVSRGSLTVPLTWILHKLWSNSLNVLSRKNNRRISAKFRIKSSDRICYRQLFTIQGVPPLIRFSNRGSYYHDFWLMYAQIGDFCDGRESLTVPLMWILHNPVSKYA